MFVILQQFNSTFPAVIVFFARHCRLHMLRRVIERIVEHNGTAVIDGLQLNVSLLYVDAAAGEL